MPNLIFPDAQRRVMPERMPSTARLDYRGVRATVMGLGRFGGGVGVTRFLVAHGARVTLTDLRGETQLADSLAQLDGVNLYD
ncbi:MAG: hypothetical protein ABGZ17_00230, partial [Planctomycetaceae bacterium]